MLLPTRVEYAQNPDSSPNVLPAEPLHSVKKIMDALKKIILMFFFLFFFGGGLMWCGRFFTFLFAGVFVLLELPPNSSNCHWGPYYQEITGPLFFSSFGAMFKMGQSF